MNGERINFVVMRACLQHQACSHRSSACHQQEAINSKEAGAGDSLTKSLTQRGQAFPDMSIMMGRGHVASTNSRPFFDLRWNACRRTDRVTL